MVAEGAAGVPFPLLTSSWFPVAANGGRGWHKAGPSSSDMKQGPVPVKKAQCL